MESYTIGNTANNTKKVVIIVFLISLIFTGILFYTIKNNYPIHLVVILCILAFLLFYISLTAFLSGYVRYMQVKNDKLILVDSSKFRVQYEILMNNVFHTHFSIPSTEIELKYIKAVQLYAVVDTRITRFTGYDSNKEKSYRVFMKFILCDNSEYFIQDWFYYKDPSIVPMFHYFATKNIKVIDHRNIIAVIENDISLADYLNGKVNL